MSSQPDLPIKQRITFGKFQNIDMRVGRVISAPMAEGTDKPCRVITIDLGHLGKMTSVGQYTLLSEEELVQKNVVVVANLAPREMGPYTSQVLILGVPHPGSPADQDQALPLTVDQSAALGSVVF